MNMDSRFSHLRQRDTSVSMLRVKMSRRKSQSQKENRERALNKRRQLDKLPEMDISSLDASMAIANMSIIQEKTINNAKPAKSQAAEERLKQLERWKERKALEKEKELREKGRKDVFKTGLFHAKDSDTIVPLPQVPGASTRAKNKVSTAPSHSTRVTRSMKTQQQKPLKTQNQNTSAKNAPPAAERSTRSRVASVKPAPPPPVTKTTVCAVEPVVRAASTRSVNRPPVTAVPAVKDKPMDKSADVRTTRSRAFVNIAAPPSGRGRNCKATVNIVHPVEPEEPEVQETEEKSPSPMPCSEEVDMVVDQAPADAVPVEDPSSLSSFAPQGFVFQAPAGLFKFQPLTPRSADAFLKPSPSFSFPPVPLFNVEPQAEPSEPSSPKSPLRCPPRPSPTASSPTPGSPLESKHDVPYFRSQIVSETDSLNSLCAQWEPKVEDESIPEEMRDRMRTAVGQARLLMKERFKQFSGLVDDCDLGRGEKITTCTDLQGFWDMVYYQVEDVNKKFGALKEAEARDWVEEHKPPPRQRKVVKKPAPAPAKPTGTKAAAKSRLAAIKAAMKAKQQAAEAEKAAQAAAAAGDPDPSPQEPQPQAQPLKTDTVLFDGGFFQVESPSRPAGPARRSSRLSAAVLPQASPCSSYLSPRRVTRRSLALGQTPVQTHESPARPVHTPAHLRLTLDQTPGQAPNSQRGTPQPKDAVNVSHCFSPVKEVSSDNPQPEGDPALSTQDSTSPAPESDTPIPVCPLPSISVVLEQDEPAEAVNADIPLSPRLSLSPCKSPPPVSETPERSIALSFTLSPCLPPQSSPTVMSSPPAVVAQESMCHTPESEVLKETPGFDFDRYLQSSQRCSLSPRETVAVETLSPMAVDVEMESPRGQYEDLLTREEAALPAVSSVLTPQSPQTQTAESDLFLFTPDLKDRIRQSVCPNDLMVFTPPS
ncbi:disks large-associated protein 5 [Scomber scombrus]|uniref:disks large-associated protein 5 n=1 Tax=Scomber scombrus TaxID=13677 RepID=UPI002DD83F5F|nr:disks large-associated protein 5 [Scomber scombrus]